jgi:hypothetical protein
VDGIFAGRAADFAQVMLVRALLCRNGSKRQRQRRRGMGRIRGAVAMLELGILQMAKPKG